MKPRPGRGGLRLLPRPRLLHQLAGPWKVASLAAPAGSGKTTLAAQWCEGRPTLWCALHPEDRDAAHLLGSLLAGGSRMKPPLAGRTAGLFQSRRDMERDGGLITASFLDELIPRRGGSRVVVLDDVHVLDGARRTLDGLRRLIEESGPRVRFLLTSRGAPPLPLARFRVMGGVVELTGRDLDFTDEERGRLLARVYGLRPTAETRAAIRSVGGWAAGLSLAARKLHTTGRAPQRPDASPPSVHGESGAFAYLAEEVFSALPPALRRSLARASWLPDLDATGLRLMLGDGEATRLLREVRRRDLFVSAPAGETPRFHPLFREFLRARQEGGRPKGPVLARIVRHWTAQGEASRAVEALVQCGEIDEASRRFDRAARGDRGDPWTPALQGVAAELRHALENAGRPTSPWLILQEALASAREGKFDAALRTMGVAVRSFLDRRDWNGAALAFKARALYGRHNWRLREQIEEGHRLLKRLPPRARQARGRVASDLGELWLHAGEPARSRRALADAARWVGRRSVDHAQVGVRQAMVEFTEGRWDVYLRYAGRAIPFYRRAGFLTQVQSLHLNMAEAHTYLGQEEAALGHLDQARSLEPRVRASPHAALEALGRGRALSDAGRAREASRAFREARARFGSEAAALGPLQVEVWEGVLERRSGRLARADRMLARAVEGFTRLNASSWRVLALMERALVLGLTGHSSQALRDLAAAARVTRRMGDRKELARNSLFEARVLQVSGKPFRPALRRALRELLREDYLVLLRKESDVALPLLDASSRARADAGLMARVMAGAPGSVVERLARVATRAPGRNRGPARGATALASHRRAADPIEVRLLGALEVQVGSRRVRFPRRASQLLIACLALKRGQPVLRESLAEWLWPEVSEAAGRNRFDVTLNAARRELEPQALARGPFLLLHSEGGRCRLLVPPSSLDVVRFEERARECEPLLARLARTPWLPGTDLARAEAVSAVRQFEEAVAAYGGDLARELPDADWIVGERERLRERHHGLLLGLGAAALATRRPDRAAEAALRVLGDAPLHEEAHRLRLRALAQRGDRATLLREHRDFVARLARELDVAPGPETATLFRELGGADTPRG